MPRSIPLLGFASFYFAVAPACQRSDAKPATSSASRSSAVASDSISQLADKGRVQGAATATVWFIEASDFQCPFCKIWHDSVYPSIVRDYVKPGKIRMAYLNFPLSQHRNALPAAEAAMCASAQGKFWEMHDALFASQQRWENLPNPQPLFDSLATPLGLKMNDWRDCVSKHLTQSLIEADRERSSKAGVGSTPSFFIGDEPTPMASVQPYQVYRQAIEAQLAKKAGGRPPGH